MYMKRFVPANGLLCIYHERSIVLMSNIRSAAMLAAILLLLTVTAYSNSFHNSFHFDDSHTIVNNLFIRNVANIPLFFKDSTTFSSLPANQTYRPVVTATLAIDYWLGGGLHDTFYFHIAMFIMFIMQGILMFFFYQKIFECTDCREGITFTALLAAGWYLLHPPMQRRSIISSPGQTPFQRCLSFLCFVLYVRSAFCRQWHLYLIPLALGMLTKPIAFIFPVLLLIYSFFFEEKASLTRAFSKKGAEPSVGCFQEGCAIISFYARHAHRYQDNGTVDLDPGGSIAVSVCDNSALCLYEIFFFLFSPCRLSADTDLLPFTSIVDARFFAGAFFMAALLALAILTSAKQTLRPISFGILWFIITLLPTSIIPLAEVMNDHRVFLPYIGLMLSVCWSAHLLNAEYRSRIRYFTASGNRAYSPASDRQRLWHLSAK